jgi:phage terminase large subunit-like protein
VQANFANGMIYAPDRRWAELVINEMEVFAKGRYDDLTDSILRSTSSEQPSQDAIGYELLLSQLGKGKVSR